MNRIAKKSITAVVTFLIAGAMASGAPLSAFAQDGVVTPQGPCVSGTVGNSTTMTVPAYKTGYAAYGANTVSVYGKSYRQTTYCAEYNVRYVTVVAPTSVGWKTWIA